MRHLRQSIQSKKTYEHNYTRETNLLRVLRPTWQIYWSTHCPVTSFPTFRFVSHNHQVRPRYRVTCHATQAMMQ